MRVYSETEFTIITIAGDGGRAEVNVTYCEGKREGNCEGDYCEGSCEGMGEVIVREVIVRDEEGDCEGS